MIERHVTFSVYPDKRQEFEKFFAEEYRPAMAGMPGFLRVDLLCEVDQNSEYQMVIRFESADTSAGWRESAAHKALQPKIKALYSDSKLQVYDVIA